VVERVRTRGARTSQVFRRFRVNSPFTPRSLFHFPRRNGELEYELEA